MRARLSRALTLVAVAMLAFGLLVMAAGMLYERLALPDDGEVVGDAATAETTTTTAAAHGRFELHLEQGWNLVSVPLNTDPSTTSSVFRGLEYWPLGILEETKVYGWSAMDADYYRPSHVHPELGYWVFSYRQTVHAVRGVPVDGYNMALEPGWNIIGSLYSGTAYVRVLSGSVCSDAYRWVPYVGYERASSMRPGEGIWVYSYGESKISVSDEYAEIQGRSGCGVPPENPDFFMPYGGFSRTAIRAGGAGGSGGGSSGGRPADTTSATTTTTTTPVTTTTTEPRHASTTTTSMPHTTTTTQPTTTTTVPPISTTTTSTTTSTSTSTTSTTSTTTTSTTTTTTTLPCVCGVWATLGCGSCGCDPQYMCAIRSCNRALCDVEKTCTPDPVCVGA